jgi:hypothetical protein
MSIGTCIFEFGVFKYHLRGSVRDVFDTAVLFALLKLK